MQDKINKKYLARLPENRKHPCALVKSQKGALLIALIITMVILSALSGGLIYIFSSSNLNPISGNFAQQAYYNAEGGFRYVTALYRVAGDKTVFNAYVTPQTITLPGGGTAKVTVAGLTATYTPATATAAVSGTNLVLSAVTGTFPAAPGFFTKDGAATIYRYTGKTTNGTGNIVLTGISPAINSGGTITTKEQTTITSVGKYGSGFWSVSRTVQYTFALSGSSGTPLETVPGSEYLNSPASPSDWGAPGNKAKVETDNYVSPTGIIWHSTDIIASDYYSNGGVRYLFIPFKHTTADVDFENARSINGNNLSYDVQTKLSMGPGRDYGSGGIGFRIQKLEASTGDYKGYVVSFMRVKNGTGDYIPSGVKPRNASGNIVYDKLLLVLWEQTIDSTEGRWLAYKVLNDNDINYNDNDFDNYVRGQQTSSDGYFIHDESSMVIRVVEKDDTSGKTNEIQVFFGDAWHNNSEYNRVQNNNPYDVERLRFSYEPALGDGNNEFPVKWPSLPGLQAWTATDNDWFTAIVWDRINPDVISVSLVNDERGSNTIIRNNIHTTVGVSYNSQPNRPEIALHTFGTLNDSNRRVYFLDFALRLLKGNGSGGSTYIGPIQQ